MKDFIKNRKKWLLILGVAVILFCAIDIVFPENEKIINVNTKPLSSKKIEWGIKRNDNHDQPDLGAKNKQMIEEYKGIAMGNSDKKYVYLTFDEGYEAGYTPKILEVLKQNEVKATFFITAHFLNTQEGLVKQMIEEGHIVGNHTVKSLMSDNLKVRKV